jgi:hypothetical protein
MKNLILILLLNISFFGCKEEDLKLDNTIYGTWQLVEVWEVSGVKGKWVTVNDGYTYKLSSSNTFESTMYEECETGTFQIKSDSLIFEYSCSQFSPCETGNSRCIEKLEKQDCLIVLTPTYMNCAEGCGRKFKKIADEIKQTD